jgi:methyl-accepting chemotaxis protein
VLALLLVVAAVAFYSFNNIRQINQVIIKEDWVKVDAAQSINAVTRDNARLVMQTFFAFGDARKPLQEAVEVNKKIIDQHVATLDSLIHSDKGKELIAAFKKERATFVGSFDTIQQYTQSNRAVQARQTLNEVTLPTLERLQGIITQLVSYQTELTLASGAQMEETIATAKYITVGLTLAGLLIGSLFAWLITRSITRPMNQAVKVARTVASGDLTSTIQVTGKDETAQLLQALKDMNDSLVGIVSKVRTGTQSMATASSQIAAGNEDLSSRTEQQASSLTETASSMEEMTSTVKQNADNAQQAHTLATAASNVASDGGKVVSSAVQTMQAINAASRKIEDIISVIDGIAFQTNILALNAAVEAARAGEQGRGFAVVASEVRTLAQRSAAAAKEIKELIENSVSKVEEGSRQVTAAGQSMEEIVTSIARVTDIVGEITAASHEQTRGIEQINMAIGQMDQVTQQNAALVEEAAAASQSLQEQAGELAKVVSVFKVNDDHAMAVWMEKDITPRSVVAEDELKKPLLHGDTKGVAPRKTAPKHAAAALPSV